MKERRKKKNGTANSIRFTIQANMAHNLTRQQSGVMIQLPLALHKTYRTAPLSETDARYGQLACSIFASGARAWGISRVPHPNPLPEGEGTTSATLSL